MISYSRDTFLFPKKPVPKHQMGLTSIIFIISRWVLSITERHREAWSFHLQLCVCVCRWWSCFLADHTICLEKCPLAFRLQAVWTDFHNFGTKYPDNPSSKCMHNFPISP